MKIIRETLGFEQKPEFVNDSELCIIIRCIYNGFIYMIYFEEDPEIIQLKLSNIFDNETRRRYMLTNIRDLLNTSSGKYVMFGNDILVNKDDIINITVHFPEKSSQ